MISILVGGPNFYLFFDFHSPKLEAIFGLSEIITTTKKKM